MLNLVGFLLPALIDLINRKIDDSDVRFWVSVLVCVLVGSLIATLDTNGFESLGLREILESIAVHAMAMFGEAQLVYKKAWEDSDVRVNLGLNAKLQ